MINSRQTFGIRLTPRETEILDHVISGMRTKEIAVALSIAENTVDNHRRNLINKKGAKNCRELLSRNKYLTGTDHKERLSFAH